MAPAPPHDPGPMPPRTPLAALLGFGAVALGATTLELFVPLSALRHYVALAGAACGLLAALLGAVALGQIARRPERFEGRPMAIAALILGAAEALGFAIFFLLAG
jgi:hypothetical protein